MPKKPFKAEIIKIYEPDMKCMVQALRTLLEHRPEKTGGEINVATQRSTAN